MGTHKTRAIVAVGSVASAALVAAAIAVSALTRNGSPEVLRYDIAGAGISFEYPSEWRITTRRLDNVVEPITLVTVTSYDMDGQGEPQTCPATNGAGRPPDGVFIHLKEDIDEGAARGFPARPDQFTLPTEGQAGCLPPLSAEIPFRDHGRAFYLWVSIGSSADLATRVAAMRVLDSIEIDSSGP